MFERVEVFVSGKWYAGDLIAETWGGTYIVRLDVIGKRIVCSKRQVRRWMVKAAPTD